MHVGQPWLVLGITAGGVNAADRYDIDCTTIGGTR